MEHTTEYDWMLSEIRLFPYGFIPEHWLACDGQTLHRNEFLALFGLIGYSFGGSGNIFNLPDLRGRVLLHRGNGYEVGKGGGEKEHVLTPREMAAHKHLAVGSSKPSDDFTPKHNFWPRDKPYRTDSNTKLNESCIGTAGKDRPHENMAPYLSLTYCIAIDGNYPSSLPEEYIGTIKTFGTLPTNPYQWEPCDGRELSIHQYTRLFSVIGTKYGGNGTTTFKLPDLRGRATLSKGKGEGLSQYEVGQSGGAAQVTLTEVQLPAHQHLPSGKIQGGNADAGTGVVWANGHGEVNGFATEPGTSPVMNPGAIGIAGENAAHNNMMPYQVVTHYIAVDGIVPPRQ